MDETAPDDQRPVSPPELQVGGTIGRYRLTRPLGTGGMGVVWAAHDPDLDREIALKVLRGQADDNARARFLREARAMARLKHPNVLTVHEVGTDAGRDYIAMELVEGGSLDNHAPADLWAALLAAGRGLAAAHDAGLVHRDFKPHNVLVDRERVLVTDFGLVGELGELPVAATAGPLDETARPEAVRSINRLTRTGSVMGTPAYMAPEQWDGAPSDPRTDQFAYGVTGWQLLTGKRPFGGDTLEQLREAASTGKPAGGGDLPSSVRAVLQRAMAPDPSARFANMHALLAALERAHRGRRGIVVGVALTLAIGVLVVLAVRPHAAEWQPHIVSIDPSYDENSDSPAISPDGKTVLYAAGRGDEPWKVYTQPIAGGPPTVIDSDDCGWSTRWEPDGKGVIVVNAGTRVLHLPIPPGPKVDLGSGSTAERCRGALFVATPAGLAIRDDGGDHVVITGNIHRLRCSRDGAALAFLAHTHTRGLQTELWLLDGDKPRRLVDGSFDDVAFTPGRRSLVVTERIGEVYDLFELDPDDGTSRQLTVGANARSVDITPDGSTLLFDDDVTSFPVFAVSPPNKRERLTFVVEQLDGVVPFSTDDRVVAERIQLDHADVTVISLADKTEHMLAPGTAGFPSRDGSRVLFASNTDDKRLMAVPVTGGTPTPIADLPGHILRGVDSVGGIHLEVRIGGVPHAYAITPDGVYDEGVAGFVIPGDAGWRAVISNDVLRIAKPGVPLAEASGDRPIAGRPAWLPDHVLAMCELKRCFKLDATTNTVLDPWPVEFDARHGAAMSPTGERLYTTEANGRVTRRKIVNFDERPWKP